MDWRRAALGFAIANLITAYISMSIDNIDRAACFLLAGILCVMLSKVGDNE